MSNEISKESENKLNDYKSIFKKSNIEEDIINGLDIDLLSIQEFNDLKINYIKHIEQFNVGEEAIRWRHSKHNINGETKVFVDLGGMLIDSVYGTHHHLPEFLINLAANIDHLAINTYYVQDKEDMKLVKAFSTETALLISCKRLKFKHSCDADIARLLINRAQTGSAIDHQDLHGQTALMITLKHGNDEIAEMLINKGANFNITDKDGRAALSFCRSDHLKQLMLSKGAEIIESVVQDSLLSGVNEETAIQGQAQWLESSTADISAKDEHVHPLLKSIMEDLAEAEFILMHFDQDIVACVA